MKTSLKSLAEMGLRPVALMVVETLVLAGLFVAALAWTGVAPSGTGSL
jgi:hypothetical protein